MIVLLNDFFFATLDVESGYHPSVVELMDAGLQICLGVQ